MLEARWMVFVFVAQIQGNKQKEAYHIYTKRVRVCFVVFLYLYRIGIWFQNGCLDHNIYTPYIFLAHFQSTTKKWLIVFCFLISTHKIYCFGFHLSLKNSLNCCRNMIFWIQWFFFPRVNGSWYDNMKWMNHIDRDE